MRYREFTDLVDDVLGRAQGRLLVDELVLDALGGRTAGAALADGTEPREVWHALCDALGLPDARRWGSDPHRQAPPRPGQR
ncbi:MULTISPECIES: DUF3046 domain-containing protein [Cellulomonas]|uniref:DUF3046 domain-containing protein n=1 Tax=Cellulomonas oligotrophica TaxID=931536 RepID=A0A7Y9FIU6_9CELL|nr:MULTISPECIES: DUF3046 domain-containing protein [Cellulomonas]NYD88181.1 hypothetical protein [Cellulomonas oligotrophica]TQL04495.1 DUF3046 family protein [Cellulomonas sp. SLBN-39]GIG33689.1 hypothetical protein Col01nite_28480 [Cellulomonas oligotrophica]